MKKTKKYKNRSMVFYTLVGLIFGLLVSLITIKISNSVILGEANKITENALVKINADGLAEAISENIEDGYKEIELSNSDKININSKILNNAYIIAVVGSKEGADLDYNYYFDNGKFTDEQMVKIINYANKENNLSFNYFNLKAVELFDEKINKSNVATLFDENDLLNIKNKDIYCDYIFKVRKVYSKGNRYCVYIDHVSPKASEKFDEYKNSSMIDYKYEEIIATYRLTVQYIDGSYKFIAVDRYEI